MKGSDDEVMPSGRADKLSKTIEELEFKFRVTEGLMLFPINNDHLYSARLAIAAERGDEALVYMMRHLR